MFKSKDLVGVVQEYFRLRAGPSGRILEKLWSTVYGLSTCRF